jgi:hypothetical protein
MSRNPPGLGDRLKIGLIATFIIVPFLLLGFIGILLAQSKAYIWAVLLLIIVIAGDIIINDIHAMIDARAVLTQEQKEKLKNLRPIPCNGHF